MKDQVVGFQRNLIFEPRDQKRLYVCPEPSLEHNQETKAVCSTRENVFGETDQEKNRNGSGQFEERMYGCKHKSQAIFDVKERIQCHET